VKNCKWKGRNGGLMQKIKKWKFFWQCLIRILIIWNLSISDYPVGPVPTINTRLQMVCTFIDTLCKYTTRVNAKLEAELLDVTGRRLVAIATRLVVEVGWRRCCLETAGSVALHWGSLGEACCSVKPDEAGELIWLVPTKVFADLLLSVVTLRRTERATRTALLVMCVLTGPRHLADSDVFHVGFSVPLSWGEITYVLLSGLSRRHLLRPFIYNRILALPWICIVTSVTIRKGVAFVSLA
jgi:hypothetical protein